MKVQDQVIITTFYIFICRLYFIMSDSVTNKRKDQHHMVALVYNLYPVRVGGKKLTRIVVVVRGEDVPSFVWCAFHIHSQKSPRFNIFYL